MRLSSVCLLVRPAYTHVHRGPIAPLSPSTWSLPTFSSAGHRRFGRNGGQNPKQIPMSKGAGPENQAAAGGLISRVLRICHLNLVLVSDFEFRISDLSLQGSGLQQKRCGTCSAPQRGDGPGEECADLSCPYSRKTYHRWRWCSAAKNRPQA